mmetsp:Transcript_1614/g.6092  ORF Transcript_1614/g.6092 Transcript_1614/m.6092 type:complete len:83 (+) Transcript_1614:899-1147(+)
MNATGVSRSVGGTGARAGFGRGFARVFRERIRTRTRRGATKVERAGTRACAGERVRSAHVALEGTRETHSRRTCTLEIQIMV